MTAMSLQDEITRSIIRGLGYRVTRGLPLWIAVAALVGLFLMGGVLR